MAHLARRRPVAQNGAVIAHEHHARAWPGPRPILAALREPQSCHGVFHTRGGQQRGGADAGEFLETAGCELCRREDGALARRRGWR